MQSDNFGFSMHEGYRIKIEFEGTVKITYAQDLYSLLSAINEKFE